MNDPIVTPAVDHVTWFGVTVPVFEHMLVGEIDELQKVLASGGTGFRQDLEAYAVIARYRTETPLKVDKLLRQPVDQVAFTRDLRRLLGPFTRAQKALFYENKRAQAEMLAGEALEAEIAMLEAVLESMKGMRTEGASLPS
jgi:hypothetical protein